MGPDSFAVFAKNFVFALRLYLFLPQSTLRKTRKEHKDFDKK